MASLLKRSHWMIIQTNPTDSGHNLLQMANVFTSHPSTIVSLQLMLKRTRSSGRRIWVAPFQAELHWPLMVCCMLAHFQNNWKDSILLLARMSPFWIPTAGYGELPLQKAITCTSAM